MKELPEVTMSRSRSLNPISPLELSGEKDETVLISFISDSPASNYFEPPLKRSEVESRSGGKRIIDAHKSR